MLSKGIPSSRQGNKVTMVCIPNPPLSEKEVDSKVPICIVFRVKTDDDAETLLKQINDHKAWLADSSSVCQMNFVKAYIDIMVCDEL